MSKGLDNMIILVTGSRAWIDGALIFSKIHALSGVTLVIEGGNRPRIQDGQLTGADRFAYMAAKQLGIPTCTAKANWRLHGKAAGPIRNRVMLDLKPDIVLAFCLDSSRGTMDCVEEARRRGIPVDLTVIKTELIKTEVES